MYTCSWENGTKNVYKCDFPKLAKNPKVIKAQIDKIINSSVSWTLNVLDKLPTKMVFKAPLSKKRPLFQEGHLRLLLYVHTQLCHRCRVPLTRRVFIVVSWKSTWICWKCDIWWIWRGAERETMTGDSWCQGPGIDGCWRFKHLRCWRDPCLIRGSLMSVASFTRTTSCLNFKLKQLTQLTVFRPQLTGSG